MYNLEELQTNLQFILKDFEELKSMVDRRKDVRDGNKVSLLIKMPKVILLGRVAQYLTDAEIVLLSCCCRSLRKMVYSPMGWKILSYSRQPIHVRYRTDKQEEQAIVPLDFQQKAMVFNKSQIEVLKQKRNVLRESLKKDYEIYSSSKEKYEGLLEKVRVERKLEQKYRDKGKILEEEVLMLEQINSSFRQNLKKLNDEFEERMKGVNEQELRVVQERQKLQNQKQALVAKIREYQGEIQKIKRQGIKAKEMLKRVNNFLVYKQL